jgi:hypothetical protein
MTTLRLLLPLIAIAALAAGALWLAFALLTSLHGYIPSEVLR